MKKDEEDHLTERLLEDQKGGVEGESEISGGMSRNVTASTTAVFDPANPPSPASMLSKMESWLPTSSTGSGLLSPSETKTFRGTTTESSRRISSTMAEGIPRTTIFDLDSDGRITNSEVNYSSDADGRAGALSFHPRGVMLDGGGGTNKESLLVYASRAEHMEQHDTCHYSAFFIVYSMFAGYAALFGLQHELKERLEIPDDSSDSSYKFSAVTGLLYTANMFFRFGQNIVFGKFSSRHRVAIAMSCMALAMAGCIGAVRIYETKPYLGIPWNTLIFSYCLGGVGIGTFEANFLSSVTPLGAPTKQIAITGIPPGIGTVLIGGFLALSYGVPLNLVYGVIILLLGINIGLYLDLVPDAQRIENTNALSKMVDDLRQYRKWLVVSSGEDHDMIFIDENNNEEAASEAELIIGEGSESSSSVLNKTEEGARGYTLLFVIWTMALDMFMLSMFSPGVVPFIYDKDAVRVFGDVEVRSDVFFAVYNLFNLCGGMCGRWMSYRIRWTHPILFQCCSVVGGCLVLLKQPEIAPLGVFIVMFADGLTYGMTCRFIDATIPMQFSLIAFSSWLIMGDLGAIVSANLITYLRDWVGSYN